MVNEVLIEKMKNLKTQWGFLKDEKNAKIDRRTACKRIIEISTEVAELDPKFEMIDMNNTIYAEFVPKNYRVIDTGNVKWGTNATITKEEQKALDTLRRLENIAVQDIHEKLPNEPMDSQKFGMIVSAYTEKLVHIYNHQN